MEQDEFPDDTDLHYLQWVNVTPRLKFLYKPHRVLFFAVFLFLVLVVNPETLARKMVWFSALSTAFIAGWVHDGPLVRPHPMFWRCVLAFTIYSIFLLFAACVFGREKTRAFLAALDPGHCGLQEPDRDYSMGCTIWDAGHPDPLHNVKSVVFDIYVPAHFFGWMIKAMILRDNLMCWTLSIAFEIVERSLKHWLPNFNECWWDSFILDVVICNGLGIFIGMKLVKILRMIPWERRLLSDVKPSEKLVRVFKQFTPRSYVKFAWKPLLSFRRYAVFWSLAFFLLLMETNIFLLKAELEVSSESVFVALMCVVHAMIGFPAIMEFYLYAIESTHTIGTYGMTAMIIAITELGTIIKMSDGYFTEPTPTMVKVCASALISVILVFPIVWFGILKKHKSADRKM